MSTPTPRTDAVDAANEFSYTIPVDFARTLERELAQAWKGEEVASRDFRLTLADLGQARRELAAERAKVRVLRSACESICEEWGRNHEAPFYAGSEMEKRATAALAATEDAT